MRAGAVRGKIERRDGKTAHKKPPGEKVPPEGIRWAECYQAAGTAAGRLARATRAALMARRAERERAL